MQEAFLMQSHIPGSHLRGVPPLPGSLSSVAPCKVFLAVHQQMITCTGAEDPLRIAIRKRITIFRHGIKG